MKRTKRLSKRELKNLAYKQGLADDMEKALAPRPVHFDYETLHTVTGCMGSTQPHLQYLPGFHQQLRDMLRGHKRQVRGTSVYKGVKADYAIVDDALARTDYAELERHVLRQMYKETDATNQALLLSHYGEGLPEQYTELFEKIVEESRQADKVRAALKVALFGEPYGL